MEPHYKVTICGYWHKSVTDMILNVARIQQQISFIIPVNERGGQVGRARALCVGRSAGTDP